MRSSREIGETNVLESVKKCFKKSEISGSLTSGTLSSLSEILIFIIYVHEIPAKGIKHTYTFIATCSFCNTCGDFLFVPKRSKKKERKLVE